MELNTIKRLLTSRPPYKAAVFNPAESGKNILLLMLRDFLH